MKSILKISAVLLFLTLLFSACIPEDSNGEGEAYTLPVLSISDLTREEGSDGAEVITLTVFLEGLSLSNVVVDWATEDMTAEAGDDFIGVANGKLLFTPTEKEKQIELTILGDDFFEEEEAFMVRLSNARNATLAQEVAMITLTNDDDPDDLYGAPDGGYETPTTYAGMDLLWADEFSGEQLDLGTWSYEIGTGFNGWGNQELQYYREDNTIVQGGNLIIEAREENFSGSNYTSSRLITMDKREFRYGRIDIRAATPEGQGLWPALWMLGANIDRVGWPACGEIDIMELVGNDVRRVHGTAHFGVSSSQHRFIGNSTALPVGESFGDEFHVFSIIWEEDRIQWLVDDEVYHELTPADLNGTPWPFNQDFFMIFNVAVGGIWPGSPDATTIFPQRMFVDYIRVFQPS